MSHRHGRQAAPPAAGAALLICLFLLVALSLLGLAAASDWQVQDRINGNLQRAGQDQDITRLSSLWAQSWLLGLPGEEAPEPCADECPQGSVIRPQGWLAVAPEFQDLAWWQANAQAAGEDPASGVSHSLPGMPGNAQAHWLIEQIHMQSGVLADDPDAELGWYRILARGSAGPPGQFLVSETIVARPWGDADWRNPFPYTIGDPRFCLQLGAQMPCGRQSWQSVP